jgi:hypothetical protein
MMEKIGKGPNKSAPLRTNRPLYLAAIRGETGAEISSDLASLKTSSPLLRTMHRLRFSSTAEVDA